MPPARTAAGQIGDAFIDAAIDPARWDAAMEVAAKETRSYGAALFPFRGRIPNVPHTSSMQSSLEVYVRDGWIHRDERYAGLPAMLKKGVVTDFDFATAEDIARRPYYQEFLAPHGLRWFAGVKVASGDDVFILSLQRTIQQGPFPKTALKIFADLSARLSSASAFTHALGFARAEAALEAFQASATAAVLIDRVGEVFRANAAAERLFGCDLQVRRRKLVSSSHEATATLDRVLHALHWQQADPGLAPPVVLPRLGRRPIVAHAVRLTSLARDVMAPARMVVVLIDLERPILLPEEILQSVFGLTSAEARLASLLVGGGSLDQSADALGIAYETARNQLKAVFAKTGTHRQAELIALASPLMQSAAARSRSN